VTNVGLIFNWNAFFASPFAISRINSRNRREVLLNSNQIMIGRVIAPRFHDGKEQAFPSAAAVHTGRAQRNVSREDTPMLIKVQYDAYSRAFKLVDPECSVFLEDEALYDLAIPLISEEASIEDLFSVGAATIAHA
jgi:hypothetical protein